MSKLIELGLIAEHFHPILSGASERFRRYLPGLRKRGINTQIFTVWHEGLEEEETIEGTSVHRLRLPPSGIHPSAELTKQTLRYFKESGQKPDVIHVLSHTLQGVPYLWEIRRHGIPCINSITMKPYTKTKKFIGRAKYVMHQWLRYNVFNQIIVSSQTIADAAYQCGVPKSRVRIIANGVNLNRFHPIENVDAKMKMRHSLGFIWDEQIVLFVGYISVRKGVDLLLRAWPDIKVMHPRAKLVLIGPVDRKDNFTASFEEAMYNFKTDRIIYLEPVEHIEAYMQIADVLVLPSRLEGMPNVVIEGMACALPCILAPFKGLPESFGKPNVNYVLTKHDPTQLATDLNGLIADPLRRFDLGQAAYKLVQKEFNVEVALDDHANVYQFWAGKYKRK